MARVVKGLETLISGGKKGESRVGKCWYYMQISRPVTRVAKHLMLRYFGCHSEFIPNINKMKIPNIQYFFFLSCHCEKETPIKDYNI